MSCVRASLVFACVGVLVRPSVCVSYDLDEGIGDRKDVASFAPGKEGESEKDVPMMWELGGKEESPAFSCASSRSRNEKEKETRIPCSQQRLEFCL